MFIFAFLQIIALYVGILIVTQDLTFNFKEIIGMLGVGLFSVILFQFIDIYAVFFLFIGMFILRIWHTKDKLLSFSSLIFSFIALVLGDHFATFVDIHLFRSNELLSKSHFGLMILFMWVFCYLMQHTWALLNKRYYFSSRFKKIGLGMTVFVLVTFYGAIIIGVQLGNTFKLIQLNLLFFVIYTLIMAVSGVLLFQSDRKARQAHEQQVEYEALQLYNQSIEERYLDLRNFRYDYQNMCLSFEEYIKQEDTDGLIEYLQSEIIPQSEYLETQTFKLEHLSNIQIPPLKSLLTAKLLHAQENAIDIRLDVRFPISSIEMKDLDLVRVVGIFLDNAIEEIKALGEGNLSVSIDELGDSVHLIVMNSCRSDILPLSQLRKEDYSTKRSNRGLGLANIDQILYNYSNVDLETLVKKQKFIQHLTINKMRS
ncbi:sensor histidine kinase [Dolosicoccus paucivorans]